MDKKDFLLRQIQKTNKKNYENYVVTRVIHTLNDPEVKFVTQQYVRRPSGYALTDLYLPQIGLHIEVDESHHKDNRSNREGHSLSEADVEREADIVDATSHTIKRVDATLPFLKLNSQIDKITSAIRELIHEQRRADKFRPWEPDKEQNPQTYVDNGFLDARDDVAFARHADACNCFGHTYKQFRGALARHLYESDVTIWFPKLYDNDTWKNSISLDESVIYERRNADNRAFIEESLRGTNNHRRLVFAHGRGPLGDVMYRFKGLYKVNVAESQKTETITYKRVATRVRTYSAKTG